MMSSQESEQLDYLMEEARLLLPWYLTNTLSDEEQELVNKALDTLPELRKEFVREEKMMRLVKENTSLLELSALDTTEQRLENTLARIEREEIRQSQSEREAKGTTTQPQYPGNWLERLFGRKLFDMNWLTPTNAVFASLLALQVGVLGYYQFSKETVYHSVTAQPVALVEAEGANSASLKQRFLMQFESQAKYDEVCDFLNEWNAQVVSGPDNSNILLIEISTESQVDAEILANNMMSQAEKNNTPVVFVGPKFQD